MRKIAERFYLFSHKLGAHFPVPFTSYGVAIYPAAIKVMPQNILIPLQIEGPVKDFTALLNLEKGRVEVSGKAQNGFFRYFIYGKEEQLYLLEERGNFFSATSSDILKIGKVDDFEIPLFERISFGVTKKGDWEKVTYRNSLKEILPYWFMLGQYFKDQKFHFPFDKIEEVFTTCFDSVFYPTTISHEWMGFENGIKPSYALYYSGYQCIRNEIISYDKDSVAIKPLYHAGKLQNVKLPFGMLDIEWNKHRLRKVRIHSNIQGAWKFVFPKDLKSFRFNGSTIYRLEKDITLDLDFNNVYLLDQFIKF